MSKRDIEQWAARINDKCFTHIGIRRDQFPCLFFQKYNPKTERFTVGLKTETVSQSNDATEWCKKIATNATNEKCTSFASWKVWRWNKSYIMIKFNVPKKQVYEPKPIRERPTRKQKDATPENASSKVKNKLIKG